MVDKLEFELKINKNTGTIIQYDVMRKGEIIGILILEEPYTLKPVQKKLLTIHDEIIKSKEEIIKEHINNEKKAVFVEAKTIKE